jgi:hypothetical protein
VLAEYYAQALVMWVSRGFDLDDVRLWLNAGPLEHDSGLAERRAGLSAADMSRTTSAVRAFSPGCVAARHLRRWRPGCAKAGHDVREACHADDLCRR